MHFEDQGRPLGASEIRYVLVVKPSSRYSDPFFKMVDFALSRFATSPAALAWELVPFSFVVDWFVDVRGVLNGIDKLVGFRPFDIVSFTRSHSYKVSTDAFLDINSPCGGSIATVRYTGEYIHYDRGLVSPSTIKLAGKSRFGKNQMAISAALITQALTRTSSKRVVTQSINRLNNAINSISSLRSLGSKIR